VGRPHKKRAFHSSLRTQTALPSKEQDDQLDYASESHSCSEDPGCPPVITEHPYVLFDSLEDAINHITDKRNPKIIGFGEIHSEYSELFPAVKPTIGRFQDTLVDIKRGETHLVIEKSMRLSEICFSELSQTERLDAWLDRPPSKLNSWFSTLKVAREAGYQPHVLDFTCDDLEVRLGYKEGPDWPSFITSYAIRKVLQIENTREVEGLTMYYGGAIHNDFYLNAPHPEWSIASVLSDQSSDGFVEVDLLVPELVDEDKALRSRLSDNVGWYFTYLENRTEVPDKIFLFERSENSYLLVLKSGVYRH